MKVSAIDPVTRTEVSIVGPRSAGAETLQRNAVNKLLWRLRQQDEKAK